jgi:short-subunit dehydrogenase
MSKRSTVVVTGASSGIGAVYADRFAARGHDVVVIARDEHRLNELAADLRARHGVAVDVMRADLTDRADLVRVEGRLADDPAIAVLVNNAGAATPGGFIDSDGDAIDALIRLNVTSVARLSRAAIPGFLERGAGAIINIASVVGLAPEFGLGVYGATKSFVLTLSQSLHHEFGERGLYVQAVLPAATRTEIWERSGRDVDALTGVMDTPELVDAALVGYDRRELVTIPPLPDASQYEAFNNARLAMLPNFPNVHAAERYLTATR